MIYPDNHITELEIDRIVTLHSQSLQGSIFSLFGPSALKSYYKWIIDQKTEVLFIERDSDMLILGACVLSHSPGSLSKRFAKNNFLTLFPIILLKVFLSLKVLKTLIGVLFGHEEKPESVTNLPEVVQIYTAEEARGKGVGRKLLVNVENYLKESNFLSYFLKTVDSKDNQALYFYQKCLFTFAGDGGSSTKRYKFFIKSIKD